MSWDGQDASLIDSAREAALGAEQAVEVKSEGVSANERDRGAGKVNVPPTRIQLVRREQSNWQSQQ
jgi:hypothetical protein